MIINKMNIYVHTHNYIYIASQYMYFIIINEYVHIYAYIHF